MRIRTLTFILLLAGALAVLGAPAAIAHHAFTAEFDGTKPVMLQGVVIRMDWVNPHSWIYIDVPQPDGSVQQWEVEAGAPNAMFRRGWNKNSIPVGTEDRGRRLPGQERQEYRQRAERDVPGRAQDVRRLVGDRRADRRRRPDPTLAAATQRRRPGCRQMPV